MPNDPCPSCDGDQYAEAAGECAECGFEQDPPEMTQVMNYGGPPRTGWPPGLLQDDDRKLSNWLASRGNARQLVDEVARDIKVTHGMRGGGKRVSPLLLDMDYSAAEARVLAHMQADPRWHKGEDGSWYFDESSTFTLAQWARLNRRPEWDNWQSIRDIA
jgi:hypothetical protein